MVLYDVTSSYFEGAHRGNGLVDFGHNRDGQRGHKQIVIGPLADLRGCPVGVSVYRGNTSAQKILADRVTELQEEYGLRDVVMVGNRGMLIRARLAELSAVGLCSVTALTHSQMLQLIQRRVIHPSLFDEREITEIYNPETPAQHYLLCRNPVTAEREGETRRALLAKIQTELQRIAAGRRKRNEAEVGAAVGKVLAHWKMGKFITWSVREGRLAWQVDEARVSQEEALDGYYVIRTDVAAPEMDKNRAVACYRSLARVERAFRSLKTVRLEIRPAYHHLDRRIEAHVFLCLLAYYVEWHMRQWLAPFSRLRRPTTAGRLYLMCHPVLFEFVIVTIHPAWSSRNYTSRINKRGPKKPTPAFFSYYPYQTSAGLPFRLPSGALISFLLVPCRRFYSIKHDQ